MTLVDDLKFTFVQALQRKASVVCSQWAQNYVILGKPVPGRLNFLFHPWSRVWYDNEGDWIGKKAAQMAMTQACLCRGIFTIDILKNDVLYILPKKNPDAADFSKSKFDPLLENSPYLSTLFNNVSNVGHKQAGAVNFYLRGSRSRSALKSISVGLKIFDEFDEMLFRNIVLAEQRSAGYQEDDIQTIKISTPTYPDMGISKEFDGTNQQHYVFRCSGCNQYIEFLDLDSLIIPTDDPNDTKGLRKSYLQCPRPSCHYQYPNDIQAKQQLLSERNAKWVNTAKYDLDGYWINGLYSIVKPLWKTAQSVIRARTDELEEQELHNSVLAKEHITKGAKIHDSQVLSKKSNYRSGSVAKRSNLITMGVDVGHTHLYVEIDEWLIDPDKIGPNINSVAIPRVLAAEVIHDYSQLSKMMYDFQVLHAIIDVDPETRGSLDFAQEFLGHVNLCRFARGLTKRDVRPENEEGIIIQVNKTSWMDRSQSRFRTSNGIILPGDISETYVKHICVPIRHTYKDDDGNIKVKYINDNKADHFAYARVYSEIALPFAVSVSESQDIKNFL